MRKGEKKRAAAAKGKRRGKKGRKGEWGVFSPKPPCSQRRSAPQVSTTVLRTRAAHHTRTRHSAAQGLSAVALRSKIRLTKENKEKGRNDRGKYG